MGTRCGPCGRRSVTPAVHRPWSCNGGGGRPDSAPTMAVHTDTLQLIDRTDAHEGPVHAADEAALYFTSLPAAGRVAIRRLRVPTGPLPTVAAAPNRANGMTMDREGRLIVCEQGGFDRPARITRLD